MRTQESLDKEHQATFLNLKFAVGTHQRLTQVYFEATVVTHKGTFCSLLLLPLTADIRVGDKFTVWSPSSEPFIVCTNIKQWVKSEGTILKVRRDSLHSQFM